MLWLRTVEAKARRENVKARREKVWSAAMMRRLSFQCECGAEEVRRQRGRVKLNEVKLMVNC